MTDIFHEVDEQLRSARLRAVALKAWPYAAGVAVAALIAAGAVYGWRAHETSAAGAASERYAAAMEALQRHDKAAAERGFAALAGSAPPAYRTLALMQQAGLRLEAKEERGAVALLDQAAAAAPNPMVGDAARLQAAYTLMDLGAFGEARSRLTALAASGHPYRMMAREALGMAALAAGDVAEAKSDLQVVTLASDASDQARNRAGAALALIQSGTWSAAPALAKAAANLSPQAAPPAPSPGQPQVQGQGQAQASGAAQ